jgi:CSLREA domain-containing protein
MKIFLLAALLATPSVIEGAVFQVNKTADTADGLCSPTDCSLREAVIAANASPGADTIKLPPGKYTIVIAGTDEDDCATGDFDIRGELTILGDALETTIVDGGGRDRVFHVVSQDIVRLEWLIIQNGFSNTGGAVYVPEPNMNVTLDRCLVLHNTADFHGGGMRCEGGVLYVRNTTVTENFADQGGGVSVGGGCTLALVFSTVSNNHAATASNGGQILSHSGTTVVLDSSIIDHASRAGQACMISNLVSSGHNIESPGHSCNLDGVGDMDDVTSSSLALGPLADNGGPTHTHAIGPASVAVNLGGVGSCPPVDQRGGSRDDGFCDIGAYELGAVLPQPIFRDGFETGSPNAWSTVVP